jgi:hypothetical protein
VSDQHDSERLAAYAVGLLDESDARLMQAHTAKCQRCRQELEQLREVSAALCAVPPELFLDGPPADGELVLQRALRQVRQERGARRGRRHRALLAAAVAALVISAGVAGISLDWATAGGPSTAAGSRVLTAHNPSTGVHMTVAITPKEGNWVRLTAKTSSVLSRENCVLLVVDRSGHAHRASTWVAPWGADTGVTYTNESAVDVAVGDIAAVELRNAAGSDLVDARV